MSRKNISLILAAVAAFAQVLTLVVYLWHEKEHDRTDYTMPVLIIAGLVISTALTAWAVYRNLADAHRAVDLKQHHEELQRAIDRPVNVSVDTAQLATDFVTEFQKRQRSRQGETGNQQPEQLPAPPPKNPDLRGDVLEILFKRFEASEFISSDHVYILANIRITNYASEVAVITQWKLDVGIGPSPVGTTKQVDIPREWYIKRPARNEAIVNDLATLSQEPYAKGLPKTGWVLFEFGPYWNYSNAEPPYNARFSVTVTDSLGGEHTFSREPDLYCAQGEITVQSLG